MISKEYVRRKNRLSGLFRFVVILGVGLAVVLTGCSDNGIVFNSSPDTDQISFFDQPFMSDALAKRTDLIEVEATSFESLLQSDLGGVIALGQDEDSEAFVVLPGSFPVDTMFTVEVSKIVTSTGESLVVYEFGPDGLQFSRSAVLRLDVAELFGKNAESVDLYWLNEETNLWEFQGEFQADAEQIVCATINHFSSYGVGTGSVDASK